MKKFTNVTRFFSIGVIITLGALLYVHQNIEIIKTGYAINSNLKSLSNCLDQHKRLVYNLSKLKSPLVLDEKLRTEKIRLVQQDAGHIYYANAKNPSLHRPTYASIKKKPTGLMDRILDTFTEKAEARTHKP